MFVVFFFCKKQGSTATVLSNESLNSFQNGEKKRSHRHNLGFCFNSLTGFLSCSDTAKQSLRILIYERSSHFASHCEVLTDIIFLKQIGVIEHITNTKILVMADTQGDVLVTAALINIQYLALIKHFLYFKHELSPSYLIKDLSLCLKFT